MAFADPQSITISGVATSLPRTSTGAGQSEYTAADGLTKFLASSAYGRRSRHVLRVDLAKWVASQTVPSNNEKVSMSVYTVLDMPPVGVGYSNAEALAAFVGYNSMITASTNLLVSKVIAGES